ncbi:MAG: hypothetical protein IJ191_04095 [Treponema sp.]|nr:hypothetical protein [Treponema sp.]
MALEKKRTFIFLYLNTGAGHVSAAKVLAHELAAHHAGVNIRMVNGFGKNNRLGHLLFEIGYNFACNYIHGLFPLIYDLSAFRFVQTMVLKMIRGKTTRYLKSLFAQELPTDVVSFHFALSPVAARAIRQLALPIKLTVIVTDPFTVPTAWFYDLSLDYLVYSAAAKQVGVEQCHVPAEQITIVPFLMNRRYRMPTLTADERRALCIRHGFNPDKKMVLLVGGGEGLPGTADIIQQCVFHKADFSIAVVCGRNKALHEVLLLLSKTYSKLDLHVFGFIDYLDELVKISDCVVIKAGPAMLMEVLQQRKPIIITTYIHNQELGNMRFAVYNDVGYFIQRPHDIFLKINELLGDNDFDKKMRHSFDRLSLSTDAAVTARLLLEK